MDEQKKRLDQLEVQRQQLEGEMKRFEERREEEEKIKILCKKLLWVEFDEVRFSYHKADEGMNVRISFRVCA